MELHYVDGCPNWQTTRDALVALAHQIGGITITLRRVDTAEQAAALGFHGSPTVLIDGVDPFDQGSAPVGLACRLYRSPHGITGSPTLEQLRAALGVDHPTSPAAAATGREGSGRVG